MQLHRAGFAWKHRQHEQQLLGFKTQYLTKRIRPGTQLARTLATYRNNNQYAVATRNQNTARQGKEECDISDPRSYFGTNVSHRPMYIACAAPYRMCQRRHVGSVRGWCAWLCEFSGRVAVYQASTTTKISAWERHVDGRRDDVSWLCNIGVSEANNFC